MEGVFIITFVYLSEFHSIIVAAYNGEHTTGPSFDVIVGNSPAVIRDRIIVSQPLGLKGDINLIHSELSKLSNIGIVTVSAEKETPDAYNQCSWKITFESKAGDVPSLQVAASGSSSFSTSASLEAGDVISVQDDYIKGTSLPISGDFTLQMNGQRTPYLPFDITASEMRAALSALESISDVRVQRVGPDVNFCFVWLITFLEDIGDMNLFVADSSDLKGTAPAVDISEVTTGISPTFDGPDYGSKIIIDPAISSTTINGLKQGIDYFIRVTVSNAMGDGISILTTPPSGKPMPRSPSPPTDVSIEVIDGSSLEVLLDAPEFTGGGTVSSYKIEYGNEPFVRERQRLSLSCSPVPEIQRVTTSAADLNEIQYIVIDSGYGGNGVIQEVQEIRCDATGGEFGLQIFGEIAYIQHDADMNGIQTALTSIAIIDSVSVSLEDGTSRACAQGGARFNVTFQGSGWMNGDVPLMESLTNQLEGARRVDIIPLVEGDSPPVGMFSLSFRSSTSASIDVSQSPSLLEEAIQNEIISLDTVENNGVVVNYVPLPNGGPELLFSVEFTGEGVGGNVPCLQIADMDVYGTNADVKIICDGESFVARNGVDFFTSESGNALKGSFRLELRGHITDPIPYNASEDTMKALLEALPNIGTVDVTRTGPSKEKEYSWDITFY